MGSMREQAPGPLIALVGPPGVGKSAVRHVLAARFDSPVLSTGVDDAGAWKYIFKVMDALPARLAIIEMCRVPRWGWHERAQGRATFYVELQAPAPIRRARLAQRGESSKRVTELVALDDIQLESADLKIDAADRSVEAIADEIYAAFCLHRPGE